ncbi:MAG TPA: adenylate/guanylate cyclase domain-containing protein, partial [Syntrophobacteraceae bacterium]|nr:adenylate/guanylate cyclase domain-containing protein [Syntrophobacteraceae bacterium]
MSPKFFLVINPATISICLVLLVAALFVAGTPILDMVELKTYDLRFLSRGAVGGSTAVALALIDEKSLNTEGRWPWPRSKIARLLDILSADGAKVVGFDIVFSEPDENSQLGFINQLMREMEALSINEGKLEAFVEQARKNADNDRALADSMKNSSARVVLGYFFHRTEADLGYRIDQARIDEQLKRLRKSKYAIVMYEKGAVSAPFQKAYAPESNLEMLTDVAGSSGHYNAIDDVDGVLRWVPLIIQCGCDSFPALSLLCAWDFLDRPQMVVKVAREGVEGIRMGNRFIPTDENGQLLINYLGPPRTFPHYSISDILRGKIPKGTFENKIVLVGATAMGTFDMRSTPVSTQFPGVEIHANVIENILDQKFMSKPNWSRIYDLFAIVLMGLLPALALPRLRAVGGLIFAVVLFVAHLMTTRFLFVNYRLWLNVVYPLLALSTTYVGITVYHYVTEERERKKIKSTFKHYVSQVVIEEMLKNPDRLKLGGDEKELTVLFSDLEGFTSHSERYSPNQMISILSDYYNEMTEEVFAHSGMLKEYVGDELMAIFGAPLEQADHAKLACAAAIAMRERRRQLRTEWLEMGRPALRARTGINSGPMLVGNIGSRYRLSYGALGDHV